MINLPARLRKKKKKKIMLLRTCRKTRLLSNEFRWIRRRTINRSLSRCPFTRVLCFFSSHSLSLFLNNKSKISNFIFFPSFSLRLRSTRGQIWRQRRNDREERTPTKRDLKGSFDRLDTDGAVLMQTAKLRGDYPIRSSD